MFSDEVVKIETDELCRLVNEERKKAYDSAHYFGVLFSKGIRNVLDFDRFENTYNVFKGQVMLLKDADIIDNDEMDEILYNFKVGLGNNFIEGIIEEEFPCKSRKESADND